MIMSPQQYAGVRWGGGSAAQNNVGQIVHQFQQLTLQSKPPLRPDKVTFGEKCWFGVLIMFKFALKWSSIATKPIASKFYSSDAPQHEQIARQMINYAVGHARSEKSGESYAQAMLILEQGLSNAKENTKGVFMLAMSTLLYERGEVKDAFKKLQVVHQLEHATPAIKVAALEGLIGLNLEAGEDVASSALIENCFQLLPEGNEPFLNVAKVRAKAVKGLVRLVLGDHKSAELLFDGGPDCSLEDNKDQLGNASLSKGLLLHTSGNLSAAKDIYDEVLQVFEAKNITEISYLSSVNMIPEEVQLGATCALGQLLSHSGKFSEAEDLLTKALIKTEKHFGPRHPKVGVVLTCIALMYKNKARMEASSGILIQEGLYRKAIDLLKAPALENEAADVQVAKRDVIALARGGYADVLCIQQNRKGEGENLKNWAESAWRNHRLSLAQALEFSESSQVAVIDTRICRVI